MNRAAQVDAELRQRAARLETDFFRIVELVEEIRAEGFYARFGFADVESYLEQRIGLSYRSVARRLAAVKAVQALPLADQDEAKAQLAALGASKAAVLAPALTKDPHGWKDWAKQAAAESVTDLQAKVSRVLGLKPRGPAPDAPGAKFLAYVLTQVGDAREEVQETFELGMKLAQSAHAVAVFISLCREVLPDWRARVQAGVE